MGYVVYFRANTYYLYMTFWMEIEIIFVRCKVFVYSKFPCKLWYHWYNQMLHGTNQICQISPKIKIHSFILSWMEPHEYLWHIFDPNYFSYVLLETKITKDVFVFLKKFINFLHLFRFFFNIESSQSRRLHIISWKFSSQYIFHTLRKLYFIL